jgi:hypothetical protein
VCDFYSTKLPLQCEEMIMGRLLNDEHHRVTGIRFNPSWLRLMNMQQLLPLRK